MLTPGMSCLAVADGGRSKWCVAGTTRLEVLSVDSSSVALEKARKLARQRGVDAKFEQVDLEQWDWGANRFDVVAAIFYPVRAARHA